MCVADKITMKDTKTHIQAKPKQAKSILFICNFNAVRSPMAEFIAKNIIEKNIKINSVGIHDDLGDINPFTVSVLNEIGLDISNHIPKHHKDLDSLSFDLFVTLSPQAHEWALEYNKKNPIPIENWPTLDPTQSRGNRENIMTAYRSVRDGLETKIRNRLLNINDLKGRSD